MRVQEIMSAPVHSIGAATSLKDVARALERHGISGVPVVDGGRVIGVVSQADLVRFEQRGEREPARRRRLVRPFSRGSIPVRTARDAMSEPAVTVDPHASAVGAAWLMTEHDVTRLPVVERGRLVGIVTRTDLVRAFARSDDGIRREIVEEVLPSLYLSPNDVRVSVENGDVVLEGEVEEELDARCLPHAVGAVVGVIDVRSEVTARHEHSPAYPPT
jgi:CBS domain-containing protein